jgi:hypothetical protein
MSELVTIRDNRGDAIQVPRAAAQHSAFIAIQLAIDDPANACAPAVGAASLHAVLCGNGNSWQALSDKQSLQALNAAHYLDLRNVTAQLIGICTKRLLTPHLQAPRPGTILSTTQWKHCCLTNLGQLPVQVAAWIQKGRTRWNRSNTWPRLLTRRQIYDQASHNVSKPRDVGAPSVAIVNRKGSNVSKWLEHIHADLHRYAFAWSIVDRKTLVRWRWVVMIIGLADIKKHRILMLRDLLGLPSTAASAEAQAAKTPRVDLTCRFCPTPRVGSVHLDQYACESWRYTEMCMDSLPEELVDMLAAEFAAVDQQGALLRATVWMGRPDLFRCVAERLANPYMPVAVGSRVQIQGLDVWSRLNGAIGIIASPPAHGHVAVELRVSCSSDSSGFGLWCPPKIRRGWIAVPVKNVMLRCNLPVGWMSVWDAKRLVNIFVHDGRRLFQQTPPSAALPGEICNIASDAFRSMTSICAWSVLEWQRVLLSCGLNIDEIVRLLKPTGFKRLALEQVMQLQIQRMKTLLQQSFHGRVMPAVAAATATFDNAGPTQHSSYGIRCCATSLIKLMRLQGNARSCYGQPPFRWGTFSSPPFQWAFSRPYSSIRWSSMRLLTELLDYVPRRLDASVERTWCIGGLASVTERVESQTSGERDKPRRHSMMLTRQKQQWAKQQRQQHEQREPRLRRKGQLFQPRRRGRCH